MEIGFNFKTHKIEKMYDYEVVSGIFDYDEYANMNLNSAADYVESFMTGIVSKIESEENYHIVIKILSNEEIDYDGYFSLFTVFATLIGVRGKLNNKGYLAPNSILGNGMVCTDFSKVALLNKDFPLGIIQLTFDEGETFVQWITK